MTSSRLQNQIIEPLISVVIPTYNRADTFIKTLKSVQQQSYAHFECLVVDDFSSDDTKLAIDQFAETDQRFKYLKNQHSKGAGGARNTGLNAANGKYITFLDSDDLLLPQALENRINAFINQPHLDLVIANQVRLKNGQADYLVNISTKTEPIVRFYSLYPRTDIPWVNNTLIRKDFLLEAKLSWQEDLERYQDVQFNLNIMLSKPKYEWLTSEPDSYWVCNDEEPSIGKNLTHYGQKLIDITKVYLNGLAQVDIKDHSSNLLLNTHIKAFCAYSLFDLMDKHDAKLFYSFITKQQLFCRFDDALLRMYHQQNSWWIKKSIRLNFKLKLHKALKDDLFLKVPYVVLNRQAIGIKANPPS